MKRFLPALIAALALAAIPVALTPSIALADDEILGWSDGGTAGVDMGQRADWTATVRCETDPARYKTCVAAPCAADSTSLKLDADRTFDLPINKTAGTRTASTSKRYMAFALDDGGIPNCKIYKQPN